MFHEHMLLEIAGTVGTILTLIMVSVVKSTALDACVLVLLPLLLFASILA